MKVLIRLRNGKKYASKVFAIVNDNIKHTFNDRYYYKFLVFDEKKEKIFFLNEFYHYRNNKHHPCIFIYDYDASDMKLNKNDTGKVNFISNDEINNLKKKKMCSSKLLDECKKYLIDYNDEYICIKYEKDIEKLIDFSKGFSKYSAIWQTEKENDSITAMFENKKENKKIEMVFSGDVEWHKLEKERINDADCLLGMDYGDDNKYVFYLYDPFKDVEYDSFLYEAKEMKYKIID